jgi:hypothetical protein
MDKMHYVGSDVHKKTIAVYVINESGRRDRKKSLVPRVMRSPIGLSVGRRRGGKGLWRRPFSLGGFVMNYAHGTRKYSYHNS